MFRVLSMVFFRFYNQCVFALASIVNSKFVRVCVGGYFIHVPAVLSPSLMRSIVRGGYEKDERILLGANLEEGDKVLEIGGAVGLLASCYSGLSSSRHVTVEANPGMVELLNKNLKRSNVDIVEGLASWEEGVGEFYLEKNFYSSSVCKRSDVSELISQRKVDINKLAKERQCNVLICDVEGFEYELIKRLDLKVFDKVLIEIHDVGENVESSVIELMGCFEKSGFRFLIRKWRGNVLYFEKLECREN